MLWYVDEGSGKGKAVGLKLMRILALLAAFVFLKYIFLNLCQQSRVKKKEKRMVVWTSRKCFLKKSQSFFKWWKSNLVRGMEEEIKRREWSSCSWDMCNRDSTKGVT